MQRRAARSKRASRALGPPGQARSKARPNATAREVAYAALAAQAARWPDLPPTALDTSGLEGREAALAHAIVDASVRRWITIAHLASSVLGREWRTLDPLVQGALLGGGAQLLFFDRIPGYAAINETVAWVKTGRLARASGLVNASLRGMLRLMGEGERRIVTWSRERDQIPLENGRAIELSADALPADPIERIAIATSHPPELLARWAEHLGQERAMSIASHNLCSPPIILSVPEGVDLTALPARSHEVPGHATYTGDRGDLRTMLAAHPAVFVQDPGSSAAVRAVEHSAPRVIVDLCAGRGTKTRQLARQFPAAVVYATDSDDRRLADLRRVGDLQPQLRVVEFGRIGEHVAAAGGGDLVLADVPCSNTGVLARRPEARYRALTAQLDRLVPLQRQIASDAAAMLAPDGKLIYSTCSLETEENEGQVGWIVRTLGLGEVSLGRVWPTGMPGEPAERYSDGSFHAVLRKGPIGA